MNKKIKKVIAVALTVGAFCTIVPTTTNLMTTKAYAATSDTQLKSIYLSDGTIDFSSSTYSYTVKVGSSVDELRITAKPKNEDSMVEIDGTNVDDEDNYRETVSLDKGKNTIKIKVTDEDDDKTRTYTLYVYRGSSNSYDDVYLRSLNLSDGDINFDKDDTSYDVSVGSSIEEIKITAKPEDSDYTVTIDEHEVDDDDDYKRTVDLDKGKNKIQIEVEDEDTDESRTYTLNITRGTSTSTANDDTYLDNLKVNGLSVGILKDKTSYDVSTKESMDEITIKAVPEDDDDIVKINGSTVDEDDSYEKKVDLNKGKNTVEIKIKDDDNKYEKIYTLNITRGTVITTPTTTIKSNQWVYVNGKMQYNDYLGNPLKSTWFWDRNVSKYYYLDSDGYKATGWLYNNSHWYLLGYDGAMLKGWQYTNGAWYYLDESGAMKTGWFKDFNGTWYYLNNNGTMRTGWLIYNGKYYYLNGNGAMAYNTTIYGYKLGSDGAWSR